MVAGPFAGSYLKVDGIGGSVQPTRYVGGTTDGPPATGTYAVGDFVIAQASGSVWVCTTAGTPGTWVTNNELNLSYASGAGGFLPAGQTTPITASGASSANLTMWYPIYVPKRAVLASLIDEVTTLEVGASSRLGVYNVTSDLIPSSLAADMGNVSSSTTGIKTVSTGPPTLAVGYYALCVACSNHSTVRYRRVAFAAPFPLGLASATFTKSNYGWRTTGTDYSAALPDPAPALTLVNTIDNLNSPATVATFTAA